MRLSIQLFTLRDALAADLDGTLATLQEAGLEYVELAGTYGRTAAEFRSILDSHGLKVSGSHVGIEAIEGDFGSVVADSHTLGNEWVIVPWIGEDRRDWYKLAQTLSELGEKLSKEGLSLAYHNHDFELKTDEGLRTLIAESGPALVYFQFDLGWIRFAGEDPQEWIWEYGPRLPLVHLKDMMPGEENPHVVAGDGVLHWDEILPACEAVGVRYGSIEMDHPPHDPLSDVRRCIEFFHSKGVR